MGLRGPWRVAPPKKISWGNSSSLGGAQEAWTPGGALEAQKLGALASRTEPAGLGGPDGTGRGSGEPDGAGRGSGEPDGAGRGSGEPDGASRGSGELDGTCRGTGGRWRGAGTGGRRRGAGTGGRWRGAGTGESEAPSGLDGTSGDHGERASRTPAQSPSQLNPPPCPAVPDVLSAPPPPWCRGWSSTLHSHHPRQAPLWWALLPALAPDLTGWALLPGRSSAQSLDFALACRSRREMALRHRWARADAPYRGEMVGWALGLEWFWRDHPLGKL